MPDDYDRRNEREYEERITAILNRRRAAIGVRVEAAPADGSIASGPDRPSWVPYVPARPHGVVGGGDAEHADPPSVLLYDKRRVVVRDDVQRQFSAAFPGVHVETRKPYPGLADVWTFDVPAGRDAYDVMTDFYAAHPELDPGPPPIGRRDPNIGRRAIDAVSLVRHYLAASHVFFWPQNQKSLSEDGLRPAEDGDDRVVVVIDTGINPAHDFLAAGPGAHYLRDKARDGEWQHAGLAAGHGTGVAAVVRQHNGEAGIFGARVELGRGQVKTVEESQIVAAIDKVVAKFPDERQKVVLNLSFGGPVLGSPALYVKLQEFVSRRNRYVVAAAGNVTAPVDRHPMEPAAWPIVCAVASHDEAGNLHDWSNYDTPPQIWVDELRNGEVKTADGSTPSDVVHWRGTSFAAPQVAATI